MRRIIVRIGATGAGAVLVLGLFAAPPAGADGSSSKAKAKDKAERSEKVTCLNDEGHTQGRSLSDPDGMSNGGADKPGCTRQAPWDADTDNDGNNGCGNDADREDDNNGNCGHQKVQDSDDDSPDAEDGEDGDDTTVPTEKVEGDVQVQSAGAVPEAGVAAAEASSNTTSDATTVLGANVTAPDADTTASTPTTETQVLGETLSAPDTLARTGAGIGGLTLLGGLLFGGGQLMVLARRFLRIG